MFTAVGCAYSCSYCYISSLIDNLNEAYEGSGVRPPSIIQDRLIETVDKEGEDILALDVIEFIQEYNAGPAGRRGWKPHILIPYIEKRNKRQIIYY